MNQPRRHFVPSPLGPLLIVADNDDRLCGLYLRDHKGSPAGRHDADPVGRRDADSVGRRDAAGVMARAAAQLEEYFAGGRTAFDLPVSMSGTVLQVRVWAALRDVPYGTTTTYGQIAIELGLGSGAARAVGAAVGRNPLSIIVPCHRVVGASGSLTGYAGGLEAKRRLLSHEARVVGGMLELDDDTCWAQSELRSAPGA